MTDLTEQWVNIYKSKKNGSYWTGAFCYKTKEEAVKDLADKENYLTTVNIEEVLKLQEDNKRLKHDVGNLGYKIKNQRHEIERQIAQNAQLKELLKECEFWFTGIVGNMNDKNVGKHNRKLPIGNFEYIFKVFSQKINEVLK